MIEQNRFTLSIFGILNFEVDKKKSLLNLLVI
jgi:hypothetical protein